MKPLYRNLFLLFGLLSLAVMMAQMPEGWQQVMSHPRRLLLYTPAIVGIWLPIYVLNAWAFQLMVNRPELPLRLPFRSSLKLTISGFAFSYTTPFGSGGAPYRIMELSRFVDFPHAISGVTLYSLLHIFSHFFLWSTALLFFLLAYPQLLSPTLWGLAMAYLLVFSAALLFFRAAYRRGVLSRFFSLLFFCPFLGKWARRFYAHHHESFEQTDHNIRLLSAHPSRLWGALLLDYLGRLLQAFEFLFILWAFGLHQASFTDALLLVGFSSLVGNLLFFLPMQLGAREGSLAFLVPQLFRMSSSGLGLYVAVFTRLREICWIALGLLLVKLGNQRLMR